MKKKNFWRRSKNKSEENESSNFHTSESQSAPFSESLWKLLTFSSCSPVSSTSPKEKKEVLAWGNRVLEKYGEKITKLTKKLDK